LKPSIPKGTRDFSPTEMVRRNYILDTIKTVYQRFGFQQIETPAMENLSTLEGKYGDEGDKLLFRILNSGPILDKLKSPNSELHTTDLTEKGLRYDLTVPFARYVVMHQNEITFPFKRYQIQPVWRADRPQKGRYREFVQCDADVIGSDSLLNEVEMIQMIDEVFSKLGIEVYIKINNRKVLQGIAEEIGEADKIIDITVAIDKINKIGWEKVSEELNTKGLSNDSIQKLKPVIMFSGGLSQMIGMLKNLILTSEIGKHGISEIEKVADLILSLESRSIFFLSLSLARGLNYYTGTIFEVEVNPGLSNFKGSLLGGGRYDNLTGIFGLPNVSGVGISFGVDRIYDVMEEMKLFDQLNLQSSTTQVMFVNFGKEEEKYCLTLLQQVRAAGINAEIYPDAAKMKKQMSYADDKKIPFVVLVGSEEMKSGELTLKNMQSGEQEKILMSNLIQNLNAEAQRRREDGN
jgi:histidyl-tRNA synthetase